MPEAVSEETLSSDSPLRMPQIFVRPRASDLDPRIQHGPIPPRRPNTWRHLVGPERGDTPFHVCDTVDLPRAEEMETTAHLEAAIFLIGTRRMVHSVNRE